MGRNDPIAYTADADIYCPKCAETKYRCAALGFCPECGAHIYPAKKMECLGCGLPFTQKDLDDHEGNEVQPIFPWDSSEFPDGISCAGCEEIIVEPEEETES